MARPKRNKSQRPAKVHDRRSTDLPRNAQVVAIEVDDPLAVELALWTGIMISLVPRCERIREHTCAGTPLLDRHDRTLTVIIHDRYVKPGLVLEKLNIALRDIGIRGEVDDETI